MAVKGLSSARKVAVITISAALYAIFFFLSGLIAVPNFTILYLPIILLGVFPIWFGLSGLAGSMIGAFIGGFFIEGLSFLAWIESITTLIIYALNWVLIPRRVTEEMTKKNLALLLGVYALTLFMGTSYVLWQFTVLGLLPVGAAEIILLPTFALNFVIEAIICPVLIRTLSPRLRNWGIYSDSFKGGRTREVEV
jgi:hypothetical protein